MKYTAANVILVKLIVNSNVSPSNPDANSFTTDSVKNITRIKNKGANKNYKINNIIGKNDWLFQFHLCVSIRVYKGIKPADIPLPITANRMVGIVRDTK